MTRIKSSFLKDISRNLIGSGEKTESLPREFGMNKIFNQNKVIQMTGIEIDATTA